MFLKPAIFFLALAAFVSAAPAQSSKAGPSQKSVKWAPDPKLVTVIPNPPRREVTNLEVRNHGHGHHDVHARSGVKRPASPHLESEGSKRPRDLAA